MLNKLNIENILFLDIETAPLWEGYQKMPEKFRHLWDHKAQYLKTAGEQSPEDLYERAGIYAEFGRIICISVGFVRGEELKIKSFYADSEKDLLNEFALLLHQHYNKDHHNLCAHNGKEFDFPYIARRMLVNGIEIPAILDTQARKPWEVKFLDTMEMWKFGDYKNFTSLELLSAIFEIPTPKDDISGKDVAVVYWRDKDLARIVKYCQKDVITIVQLFRKFQLCSLIPDSAIRII